MKMNDVEFMWDCTLLTVCLLKPVPRQPTSGSCSSRPGSSLGHDPEELSFSHVGLCVH